MTTRTTKRTVTFARPFSLDEIEGLLPAGAYSVETEEETLDGLCFVAYRRVSTHILIASPDSRRMQAIDPAGLERAIASDKWD